MLAGFAVAGRDRMFHIFSELFSVKKVLITLANKGDVDKRNRSRLANEPV